ncbi:unnamed protein product [Dovyalis caffra]|uniref:F-box domain-containing protein n=1 Tax=Dovyalis caffra TaxID=77055 RepID=A0AAV1S2R9_9ROSI|nr:unnamed protein product [Dovyalis caffra]
MFTVPFITDILLQLPVKSVLRFRSLSKPICSLIDGPDFINLHLNHSITTKSNHSIILKEWDVFNVDFDNLSAAVEVKHHPLYAGGGTEVIGSVNGLVFLRHSERNIAVYNLSTREWKKCYVPEIEPPRRDLITMGLVMMLFVMITKG